MVGATGIEPVTPTMSMCKSFGSASNNYEISYCKNWIFRDRHFVATQLEYRFPLWWRFGAVAFAGIGDVFGPSSDLSIQNLKYSVGTGLRFVVDPAERLNVRLDYGYGTEGGCFYFVVGESF